MKQDFFNRVRPTKKLPDNIRTSVLNDAAIRGESTLKAIAGFYFHTFGTQHLNPLDRYSVQHHLDRVKLVLQKEPNIMATAKDYKQKLKFSPPRTWQELDTKKMYDLTDLETFYLRQAYDFAFPQDVQGYNLQWDVLRVKRLNDLKDGKLPMVEYSKNLHEEFKIWSLQNADNKEKFELWSHLKSQSK